MITNKTFICKIPNAGPLSMGERITDLAGFGLWRRLMRDATAKIQEGSLSLVCADTNGNPQTVISVPLNEINSVHTRRLSINSQRGVFLRKSMGTGVGIAILVFVMIILKAGGFRHIDPENVISLVLFCLICGIVIGYIFVYLPNSSRAKGTLVEFTLSASGNRVIIFAVKPSRESMVLDILSSAGLNVDVASPTVISS